MHTAAVCIAIFKMRSSCKREGKRIRCLLYIVRHGIPDYATDSLTEEGHRQAEALAKRFARNRLDEVYVSPRGRAIETVKPTCEALGLELKILPFMGESWAAKHFSFRSEDGTHGWCYWHRQLMLGDDSRFDDPADFGRITRTQIGT